MFVIAGEPWTIENGMLTSTMKIKRSKLEAAVAGRIDGWYAAKGPVLWVCITADRRAAGVRHGDRAPALVRGSIVEPPS